MAAMTLANSTYIYATGFGFQSNLHFTGAHWKLFYYPGSGADTSPNTVNAYIDGTVGASHIVPNTRDKTARGYRLASCFNPMLYKIAHVWAGLTYIDAMITSNYDLDVDYAASFATTTLGGGVTGLAWTRHQASMTMTSNDGGAIWIADNYGNDLKVSNTWSGINNITWDAAVSFTYASTPAACLTALPDYGMAAIISVATGTAIYCRYYDTDTWAWGTSDETITTSIGSWRAFCSAGTRAGELIVFWRDATTATTIMCRVRSAGVSGTWGTAFEFCTDASASTFPCCTENQGEASQVFFYYIDGSGDLVYRTLTSGAAIGSKVVLVASLPTLKNGFIQSPRYSIQEFGVTYHESTSGDIKLVTHQSEPAVISGSGTGVQVAKLGFPYLGTANFEQHIKDYGDYSFLTWNGIDGASHANVYNKVTKSWEFTDTKMDVNPHWDAHNLATIGISLDGYIYLAMAGRYFGTEDDPLIVVKSNYPLGHASFTMTAFTDISPTTAGITEGRGYKYLAIDANGIVHLGTCHQNVMSLRNYNGSTWTTITALANIYDFGGTSNDTYVDGMLLGKETSGQESLNVSVVLKATSTYGFERSYFLRVIYQPGTRTYLMEDIAGASITMPIDSTYTSGDAICYDGAVDTENRQNRQGFTIQADNSPVFAFAIYTDASPAVYVEVVTIFWSGSAWTVNIVTEISSTFNAMALFEVVEESRLYMIIDGDDSNGTRQLWQLYSVDGGATWTSPVQRTSGVDGAIGPSVDSAVIYTASSNYGEGRSFLSSDVWMLPKLIARLPREPIQAFF